MACMGGPSTVSTSQGGGLGGGDGGAGSILRSQVGASAGDALVSVESGCGGTAAAGGAVPEAGGCGVGGSTSHPGGSHVQVAGAPDAGAQQSQTHAGAEMLDPMRTTAAHRLSCCSDSGSSVGGEGDGAGGDGAVGFGEGASSNVAIVAESGGGGDSTERLASSPPPSDFLFPNARPRQADDDGEPPFG